MYSNPENGRQVIAYTCNWSAYSAIETAGLNRKEYPAAIKLVRLPCLSRINTGLVLRAFELGAAGVLLLGCPPEDCHYGLGATQAKSVVEQSGKLLALLGMGRWRLAYIELPAGKDDLFVSEAWDFVRQLGRTRPAMPPVPAMESEG